MAITSKQKKMINNKENIESYSIVIVGNGDYPRHKNPLYILTNANLIIACDNAFYTLKKNRIEANYIVGDMDSLSPSLQKKYNKKIFKNPDQETNDQTKAFHFALDLISKMIDNNENKNITEYNISFVGFFGKREDHTIGNASLLVDYAEESELFKRKITLCSYSDYGIFIPVLNSCILEGEKGKNISIFAFDHTLTIESKGLEYQTKGVQFDMWWKATLNRFNSKRAILQFSHPSKVLIYLPY